jgi:ubiquitin-like protein Pup
MADQDRLQRRDEAERPSPVETPLPAAPARDLLDDVDELLDEIDEVLETNAEEFVRGYVQKGGE